AAQRRARARGHRAGAVPPADGRPHRLQARPAHHHRGRRRAGRGRDPPAGRPARGVLVPGRRADDGGPGAGRRGRGRSAGPGRRGGATTRLQGDRLEACSYLVAGLMTGGQVRVAGCSQDRLVTAIDTLQKMGARFEITDDHISAHAADGLRPVAVQTDTHPGFMTDWQPPLIVLMTQADGMSVIHETVYEDRLGYVRELTAMGAEVELFDTCLGGPACRFHDTNALHSAVVRGVSKLRGAEVTIPDVRAGFSSVIAAAVADGPSTLYGIHHLERGYNRPFETLESLGLKLERVPVAQPPSSPSDR